MTGVQTCALPILFDGLYISKSECMEYAGKYPVIRLDFKDLKGSTYESIFESLKSLMSITYSNFKYIQDSIEEESKIKFVISVISFIWIP